MDGKRGETSMSLWHSQQRPYKGAHIWCRISSRRETSSQRAGIHPGGWASRQISHQIEVLQHLADLRTCLADNDDGTRNIFVYGIMKIYERKRLVLMDCKLSYSNPCYSSFAEYGQMKSRATTGTEVYSAQYINYFQLRGISSLNMTNKVLSSLL